MLCGSNQESFTLPSYMLQLCSCRFAEITTASVAFSSITGVFEHVKDLSCVSKDFCRIVIVDNNPFSFILQPFERNTLCSIFSWTTF